MKSPHPLDGIHMSAFARESAKAQMLRAEFISDLVVAGLSKLRSAVGFVTQPKSPKARRALAS